MPYLCLCAGLCGFFAHGPLSHFWYLACDDFFSHLPVRSPVNKLRTVQHFLQSTANDTSLNGSQGLCKTCVGYRTLRTCEQNIGAIDSINSVISHTGGHCMVPSPPEDRCGPDSMDSNLECNLLCPARSATWGIPICYCNERENLVARPNACRLETLACCPSRHLRDSTPGAQVGCRNNSYRSQGVMLSAVHQTFCLLICHH